MNIIVLAGGISTEREVSLSSGSNVYKALKKKGHNVAMVDVYLGIEDEEIAKNPAHIFEMDKDWAADVQAIRETNPDIEAVKAMRPDGAKNFFGPNVIGVCQAADVVFMALHGQYGEDGKIQACFDLMGICYTGTGCVSSAIAMDKAITKDLFNVYQIPAPKGIRLKKGQQDPHTVPFPCVVKVCTGGSSVGVYMVHNEEEYRQAKEEAFGYGEELVIEQYIKGREFSVAVMDGKAMPVIEIAPLQGFYDYKNKYQAGSTVETCPADLPEDVAAAMQRAAETAFEALRLKNYARMDFMMDENEQFYCLEANTLPGMTPTSLMPQEAQAMGIDFPQLCENIVQSAWRNQ